MKPYIVPIRVESHCFLLFFINTRQHILVRIGTSKNLSEEIMKLVTHVLVSPVVTLDIDREYNTYEHLKNTNYSFVGLTKEIARIKVLMSRQSSKPLDIVFQKPIPITAETKGNPSIAKVIIYKSGNLRIVFGDDVHFDLFDEINKPFTGFAASVAMQKLEKFEKILSEEDFGTLFDIKKNNSRLTELTKRLESFLIKPDETHIELNVGNEVYDLKILFEDLSQDNTGIHSFSDNSIGIIMPEMLKVGKSYTLRMVSGDTIFEHFDLKVFSVQKINEKSFLFRLHPVQYTESFKRYFEIIEILNKYFIINHLLNVSQ